MKKDSSKGKGKSTSKDKAVPASASPGAYRLLRSPIVTEKTSMFSADRRRVAFKVPRIATKADIRHAVETVFGVQVQSVHTSNVLGKVKRTSRSSGRRASYKKAYITLKEGQTIDIVEGV